MKKFWELFGAGLKLAFCVVLLIGCIFLIKTGMKISGSDTLFPWVGKTDEVVVDTSVAYDDIYNAYQANELAADELYKNNRYRITATVHRISNDGVLNWTGGATISMRAEVGDKVVSIAAEFEKDQEDKLKRIAVGDEITFEGKCVSAGAWVECEIVE